jgi:Phosphotransferase enzyme family
MPELTPDRVQSYLCKLHSQEKITVVDLRRLGESAEERSIKKYGYGTPVLVDYLRNQQRFRCVIHTMSPGPFGHEHMADRAQVLLWEHASFNRLPQHVRTLDVGGFTSAGGLNSCGDVEEFFLLTEYVEGQGYFLDLARVQEDGSLMELDLARADALCDYLADIHKVPGPDPGLYLRRIRELLGHGECIMGLTDSYPPSHDVFSAQVLEQIEHLCVGWRWRLKHYTHRLRQVHGDFHPWNILFQSGTEFRLLDRSRGEYGDPADDVASLTLNYVFSALQCSGRAEGGPAELFHRFWRRYLEKTGDREILAVVAPFFAFRALVMASPVWYPSLSTSVRTALLNFIHAVLQADKFDPARINEYCGT